MRFLVALLFVVGASPVFAACQGNDLFASMGDDQRGALETAANVHPYPHGILWHATRGTESVHLVGTMHFHDPRHDATLEQVKPWIDAATSIFLEVGEGDEARLQDKIARDPGLAFIVSGPTLPDLLPPDDWALLTKAMSDRGVPGFMAAKMKPWMAMLTLGLSKCVLADQQAGLKGLDQLIIAHATDIGNPAQALEPIETALNLFSGYTEQEMLEFLSLSLRQTAIDPNDQHVTLVESYFDENIRILWEFSVQQGLDDPQGMTRDEILTEFARLEDVILSKRNQSWMDHILPAAKEGPVFVAVGALHLPGEQGVLRLLEREGFTITRVERLP